MLRCLNIEFPSSGLSTQSKKRDQGPVARETDWNARNFQLLGLGTAARVLLRCDYRTVTVPVHIPPWTRTRLLSLRQDPKRQNAERFSLFWTSFSFVFLHPTQGILSRPSQPSQPCTSVPLGSYCVCRRFARSYQLRYLPFQLVHPDFLSPLLLPALASTLAANCFVAIRIFIYLLSFNSAATTPEPFNCVTR
jgi:hypothetical protein